MMTAPEYERATRLGAELSADCNVQRAREIVQADFAEETGLGILRMREHQLFRPDFEVDKLRQVLREVFTDATK
jgi:hypothetical protein